MAYSTLTTLAQLLNSEVIAARMMSNIRDAVIMPPMVHRKDMLGANTSTYRIPIAPTTAGWTAMTEATTALTPVSYTPTGITATPGLYGRLLGFTLQDRLTLADFETVAAQIRAEHVLQLGQGIDDALIALFTSGGYSVGTTLVTMSGDTILAGVISARVNKCAAVGARLCCCLHPTSLGQVGTDLLNSGATVLATGVGNSVLAGVGANSSGPVADWLGTLIYTSGLVDTINDGNDYCGAIHPMARNPDDVDCPLVLAYQGGLIVKSIDELTTATDLLGLYYGYGVRLSNANRVVQVIGRAIA